MKIAASAPLTPLRLSQRTVLTPTGADPLPASHARELAKAIGVVAAKNVSAAGVAGGAWKLTTVPHTTSVQDLTTLLTNNNVTPEKAPVFANDIRQLLSNPAVRAVLFGVSGGAAAYIIVEKTPWSRRTKWLVTIGAGLNSAGVYLLLRHYGILK